jgi:hypothetical protein
VPVIALAGRRIDAPNVDVPRFPKENIKLVHARMDDVFRSLNGHTLVCSAACGPDLLALEIAESLGMKRRIVLPFDRDTFRKTSVIDCPGDWGRRFDIVMKEAGHDGIVLVAVEQNPDDAYRNATVTILKEAERLSNGADTPVAVAVWDGQSRGVNDLTAEFLELAQRLGFATIEISTL